MRLTFKYGLSTLLCAGILAAPLPATANDKDTAKALAGIVALGIIGAAVAEHQHDEGYRDYKPHPKLHPDENAVGACMHHGLKIVRRAGGYDFELERVRRIDVVRDTTIVVFNGTGYYPFGKKTSRVECQVRKHRVVSFTYN